MDFSAYCKCGHVAKNDALWREHVKSCDKLKESTKEGPVEIRYPDLAPLRGGEADLLQQNGFKTWTLPRYARTEEDKFKIEEEPYGETLPVYVSRSKATDEAKGGALTKIATSTEAQKALVALLQCTDISEHGEAIKEFAESI